MVHVMHVMECMMHVMHVMECMVHVMHVMECMMHGARSGVHGACHAPNGVHDAWCM